MLALLRVFSMCSTPRPFPASSCACSRDIPVRLYCKPPPGKRGVEPGALLLVSPSRLCRERLPPYKYASGPMDCAGKMSCLSRLLTMPVPLDWKQWHPGPLKRPAHLLGPLSDRLHHQHIGHSHRNLPSRVHPFDLACLLLVPLERTSSSVITLRWDRAASRQAARALLPSPPSSSSSSSSSVLFLHHHRH